MENQARTKKFQMFFISAGKNVSVVIPLDFSMTELFSLLPLLLISSSEFVFISCLNFSNKYFTKVYDILMQ